MPKDVGVVTYVPEGYDAPAAAKNRFPVVFFLHGLFENADRWVQRGGASMLEAAIAAGDLPPAIVVAPDAGMSFYCDTIDGKRPYARFFIEECVPWADASFRTRGSRASRVLVGSSMGGFGALHFAFMRPDLFAAVAVHSAAILPDDVAAWSTRAQRAMGYLASEVADVFGDPIDSERWKSVNPMHLARRLDIAAAPAIYLDCGSEDRYAFDDGCRALGDLLGERKIPRVCEIRPGNHGWDYLKDARPHALRFLGTSLKKAAESRAAPESR
jgi:S-formylglutathione hydrolase FrmB